MLSQKQADHLLEQWKQALRTDVFYWVQGTGQDEVFVLCEDSKVQFILSLKRNPFELRLHLRTRERDIGLARVDAHQYHLNPDGTELRDTPHLHLYREGLGLGHAEPVTWYDPQRPLETLEAFLEIVHARFLMGYTLELIT